jgi:hypothetical protein
MGNARLRARLLRTAAGTLGSNPPVFLNAPSETATQNVVYPTYTPNILGGKPPFTYVLSAALPAGMSHNTSTGVISGIPTGVETKTNLVQIVTDSLGRVGYQHVFQIAVTAAPASILPSPQTMPIGDQTLKGWGAWTPVYNGTGYLNITAGNTGGIFAMSGNKIIPAGIYGAAAPAYSASYTLTLTEYSDAGLTTATGRTATINVTRQTNTFSVANSNEIINALCNTGGAAPCFGDDIRVRGGSYTGWYANRGVQTQQRSGGPTAPTTECASGWIHMYPDDGANVVSIGAHQFYGSAVTHTTGLYIWVSGIDMRRYNPGGWLANTNAVLEARQNNGYDANFVKVWGCEISSNQLDILGGEVAIPQSDAPSGRVSNILNLVYLNGNAGNIYVRDCYLHDGYHGFNTSAHNTYMIHNRIRRIWDDCYTLKAYASHKYNWNYIYDKPDTPYGSGHMDSWQVSLANFGAGIYAHNAQVCCNIIIRGDAGQTTNPDLQGAPFMRTEGVTQAFIQGVISYANFMNVSRGTCGLIESPKDCKMNWMSCSFGVYRDAGTGNTVQLIGFGNNLQYYNTCETSHNISGNPYNFGDGVAFNNLKAVIADYPAVYTDPIRDTNNNKAEIIRRWTTKTGGPGDAAVHSSGHWIGALTPYVTHDTADWQIGVMTPANACHASFPDGFTLNLDADDTYVAA